MKIQTLATVPFKEVIDCFLTSYLALDSDGNIIQLESRTGDYLKLLTAAGAFAKEAKMNNVDAGREDLLWAFEKLHFSMP